MNGSTLFLPNAAPNWQQALNDLNQSGQAFVVAPVEDSVHGLSAKLLVFRDSLRQLRGVFMIYLPDAIYHTQTNGNYTPSTFTGIVVYTDVNGQAFLSCKIVNGQIERLYNAEITDGRGATIRDCLDVQFPDCPQVFTAPCGSMRFCDCSGNCGPSAGTNSNGDIIVWGSTGSNSGSPSGGFSYGSGGGGLWG